MAASKRPVIAIFASGNGTTAEAFIIASGKGEIDPVVGLVITNNSDAGIIKKVKDLNKQYGFAIKTVHISGLTHPAKDDEEVEPGNQTPAEEAAILELLQAGSYDVVVLMGYMKKIGSKLVNKFGWRPDYTSQYQARMLNTHPGLLPQTRGLFGEHVQKYTIANNLAEGGQTLHIVAEDYDDGPVVAEHRTKVLSGDTVDSLFDRVKTLEKKHLPNDVANFITERNKWRKQHG